MAVQMLVKTDTWTVCAGLVLIHMATVALADHHHVACSYDCVDGFLDLAGADTVTVKVRSRLECSRKCSQQMGCCGFGYFASDKLCRLITSGDIPAISVISSAVTQNGGPNVYLDETCSAIYQGGSANLESTGPTLSPSTAAATTPHTIESTPVNTSPAATTQTATTQNAPTTPLALTTNTSTTANTTDQCVANALFCGSGDIFVVTPGSLLRYSNLSNLTSQGPTTRTDLNSKFTNEQGDTIVAAYINSSSSALSIITKTHFYVFMYSATSFEYKSQSTLDDHFGISLNSSIAAAMELNDSSSVYLFTSDDWLYIVSRERSLTAVNLDKNTSINPYQSEINEKTRARDITAACALDAKRDLFISSNAINVFHKGERRWSNLGVLHC